MTRNVCVTGIGLVSASGTTGHEHLSVFDSPNPPRMDATTFAPFTIFPAAPYDITTSVPGRSDRRQMEPWQRLGVTAAKLALDSAGLSGSDAMSSLYLNLAANGGAREHDVDMSLLADCRDVQDRAQHLNQSMKKRIRPSFLLGQLPNMLAGNIGILLGAGGGARTFMGEEYAGVEALSDAVARIRAQQSDRILVGGVFDAERADIILSLALGGALHPGALPSVFDPARNGISPGTMSAFMVLEDENCAKARRASLMARITSVKSLWTADVDTRTALSECINSLPTRGAAPLVVSGASGMQPATTLEYAAIKGVFSDARIWSTSDLVGHGLEATFLFQVALAVLHVRAKAEDQVLATIASDRCGVSAALIEATR